MFIPIILITTLLAIANVVYAAPTDRPLYPFDDLLLVFRRVRTPSFGVHLRRQSSDNSTIPLSSFPPQCQKGCAPAINAINNCTSTSCVCNPTVDSSLSYCLNCSVNADPTPTAIQTGQQLMNMYNNACNGTGVATVSFTVTSTDTTGSSYLPMSTTTGNVTQTSTQSPTTTASGGSQTGTSSTSSTSTASGKSNDAPIILIQPNAALTSIGLAMMMFMVIW